MFWGRSKYQFHTGMYKVKCRVSIGERKCQNLARTCVTKAFLMTLFTIAVRLQQSRPAIIGQSSTESIISFYHRCSTSCAALSASPFHYFYYPITPITDTRYPCSHQRRFCGLYRVAQNARPL